MDLTSDKRIVMTLDAGGTNFRFSAMRGGESGHRHRRHALERRQPRPMPDEHRRRIHPNPGTCAPNCRRPSASLSRARRITRTASSATCATCRDSAAASRSDRCWRSFSAFPAFINNDGDLFVYGEAIAGFLPYVNGLLEKAGSPKRYKNLFGVTLGTGFGGGIVLDGRLLTGDNSISGEVWLLRNKLDPGMNAEEGASIRAVRRVYARKSGHTVRRSARAERDLRHRDGQAARQSCGSARSLPPSGRSRRRRDGQRVDAGGRARRRRRRHFRRMAALSAGARGGIEQLLHRAGRKEISTPGFGSLQPRRSRTNKKISCGRDPGNHRPRKPKEDAYDPLRRIGVGISRLGTSEAVAIGAYAFALRKLDAKP